MEFIEGMTIAPSLWLSSEMCRELRYFHAISEESC